MLELWRMWSNPLLPLLPGPHWPKVAAPDRDLSLGQIELNSILILNWIVWNRTVYMYKNGFGIYNLQRLICHRIKPNQTSQGKYQTTETTSQFTWSCHQESCKNGAEGHPRRILPAEQKSPAGKDEWKVLRSRGVSLKVNHLIYCL